MTGTQSAPSLPATHSRTSSLQLSTPTLTPPRLPETVYLPVSKKRSIVRSFPRLLDLRREDSVGSNEASMCPLNMNFVFPAEVQSATMTKRVAIVGGGITGACAARRLCSATAGAAVEVHLFDQGRRGVGGRTSTRTTDFATAPTDRPPAENATTTVRPRDPRGSKSSDSSTAASSSGPTHRGSEDSRRSDRQCRQGVRGGVGGRQSVSTVGADQGPDPPSRRQLA